MNKCNYIKVIRQIFRMSFIFMALSFSTLPSFAADEVEGGNDQQQCPKEVDNLGGSPSTELSEEPVVAAGDEEILSEPVTESSEPSPVEELAEVVSGEEDEDLPATSGEQLTEESPPAVSANAEQIITDEQKKNLAGAMSLSLIHI